MRFRFSLLALSLAAFALALPAQVVASGSLGVHANRGEAHTIGRVAGSVAIALPPLPHALFLWNIASAGFDRQQNHNGGSIGTGLELWLSPALRPAESWGPLVLGEVAVGRRFGLGLHGYTAVGGGVGWSLGDWIPYVEFRRRISFHPHRPGDDQVIVGLKFILFG